MKVLKIGPQVLGFDVRIPIGIDPVERGERFEDPVGLFLEERNLGEATGGGTWLSKDKLPEKIDIEIELKEGTKENIALVIGFFESKGVPKGSKIIDFGGKVLAEFGKNECCVLYLNGHELPAETYQKYTLEDVTSGLTVALGEVGSVLGTWGGPTETAVYICGPSFKQIIERTKLFVSEHPLCQKSRIIQTV